MFTESSHVKDLFSLVQGGVNNMLRSPAKDLYLTRVVESIVDMKPNPNPDDDFHYFDPKVCFFIYLFYLFILFNYLFI